jgi:hypothetical protein
VVLQFLQQQPHGLVHGGHGVGEQVPWHNNGGHVVVPIGFITIAKPY